MGKMKISDAYRSILKSNGIIKYVDTGASSLNNGVLQTAKLDRFIQKMKDATVLMDAATLVPMSSETMDLDRMDLDVELESPVRDPETGNMTLSDQEPDFKVNQLNAKKFRAKMRITQDALDENIEGQALINTVDNKLAAAGGRAAERVFIYGDTSQTSNEIPGGYKAINGWIKKVDADNILYGGGTQAARDIDPTNIDDILTKLYDTVPGSYVEQSSFFLPPKRVSSYRRSLKSKDSALGDLANLQAGNLTFEGRPVVPVPALGRKSEISNFFGPLDPMFFGPAENFAYGIRKAVEVRIWEDIDNELWKLRFGFKGDADFKDEEVVALALPGETAPSG